MIEKQKRKSNEKGKNAWKATWIWKHDDKMQRSFRTHFSPCLLSNFGNCSLLGVNEPVWEVGSKVFPQIPYSLFTHFTRNLFPDRNVNVVVNATKYKHEKKDEQRKGCKGVMVKIVMEIEMDRNTELFCKGANQ